MDYLRPDGALRWKVEDRRLGRSGSVMWKAGTSKSIAPSVLVEDRWVGPREQVLNVLIACRKYGPGKPGIQLSMKTCLFPTTSLAVMGEKLGTDLQIGQSSCCGFG
jgi:hypothetical protein